MNQEQYEAFLAMGQRNTRKLAQTPKCPICGGKFFSVRLRVEYVARTCAKGHETKTELEIWEPQS